MTDPIRTRMELYTEVQVLFSFVNIFYGYQLSCFATTNRYYAVLTANVFKST